MSTLALGFRRSYLVPFALAMLVIGGVIGGLLIAPAAGGKNLVPMYINQDAPASSPPSVASYAPVLKPVLPAVVNISSSRVVKVQNTPMIPFNDPFFQQFFGGQFQGRVPRQQREESLGSGVIVSPDGYILTNNHVVEHGSDIKVFLADKRQFAGKVVGTDPQSDVALVKIDAKELPTVTFGQSRNLQVGDLVFAIGDPFGIGETATMGIISATGRSGLQIEDYEDFIQTDASINPGNSGGALVNARGELIGINTAILSGQGGGNQGIGFAIPIDMARNVMDQILKHGKVVRGYLGVVIQEITPALGKALNVPAEKGALVSDVTPDGPGAKAGLQRGDVITAVNGQPVNSNNDLRLQIAQMAPGTVVHLKVLRNGQSRDVAVTLGELPQEASRGATGQPGGGGAGLMQGVQVEDLTPDIASQLKLPASTKGVVVDEVQPGSPAQAGGLQRGDVIEQVNHQPVNNTSDYQQAVSQAGKESILLLINRGGQTAFIVVQPQ